MRREPGHESISIEYQIEVVPAGYWSPWPSRIYKGRILLRHIQQLKLMPTRHFQRTQKAPRPSPRFLSILGAVRFISDGREIDAPLPPSFLTSRISIQVISYALYSSRHDCPFYRPIVLVGDSEYIFDAIYAPRMFKGHSSGPRGLEVEINRVTECFTNTIRSP